MTYLLAAVLWLMAICGWAGYLLTSNWRGSIAGTACGLGALVAILLLFGRPPKN